VVLAALIGASVSEGWIRVRPSDVRSSLRDHLAAAFRHGVDLRLFDRVDHEQGSVIQMGDLAGDWLDSPYRDETPADG
jgi:hypothetical protein